MEIFLKMKKSEYKDYYAFSLAFDSILRDYALDYDSVDYVL
jgi:hypothetical protein